MKSIKIESGTISYRQQDGTMRSEEVTTADLINECLNVAPAGGFTYKDFKQRKAIDDALQEVATGADLELSEESFEALRECVALMKWAVRSELIYSFVSQFEVGG